MVATQVQKLSQYVEFDAEDYPGSVFIREVRPTQNTKRSGPVLLMHGATLGSTIWDIGVKGYSVMNSLALQGYRVFSFDAPGFSRSQRAIVGSLDGDNILFPTADKLMSLLDCIVDWVRTESNCEKIVLGGGSWGAVVAALYCCNKYFQRKVERLFLYAPLYGERNQGWLTQHARPGSPSSLNWEILSFNGTNTYRMVTEQSVLNWWDSQIPSGKNWRDKSVSESLINEELSVHRTENISDNINSFLVPNGPLLDLLKIFNGKKIYDPSLINLPTLIVRGDHDTASTHSDAFKLFKELGSSVRQYKVIGDGAHFMFGEKNAWQLHSEIISFLQLDLTIS